MLGVTGGDEVQFRFDIGRDGCGGNDGWYVDNVEVTVCKVKGPRATRRQALTVRITHQIEAPAGRFSGGGLVRLTSVTEKRHKGCRPQRNRDLV